MEALISDLAAFIERNRVWAGPVLGLVTFGESMVFIGAFFPATALMAVAGGLAAMGILDPLSVLLWCVGGAVAGDAVSYWLGRRTGPAARRSPWMRRHRAALARGRLFFRRHGSASVYLCRFMGPVRAFVPLIAGMTEMDHRRFQVANIGSALVWVPAMLAPGYVAAESAKLINLQWLGVALLLAVTAFFAAAIAWGLREARTRAAEWTPPVARGLRPEIGVTPFSNWLAQESPR